VTPGYRRSLSLRGSEAGSGEFWGDSGDFASSFAWLFDQDYAFAGVPFAELYDAATAVSFSDRTDDFSEAAFEAEGYLRLSRRVSSRLVDLLLPASLEMALGRELKRAGDLVSDCNRYTVSARAAALNLFGSLGAYSLFPFYRTDEFSSSVSLLLRDEGGRLTDGELLLEHFASFEGATGSQLTLHNRYSGQYDGVWSSDDILELFYTWERHPQGGVRLPLLPASVGQEAYWIHLEGLALDSEGRGKSEGPGGEGSFHPVNVILTHESSVVLPEHGSLKASLGVGFDLEQTEAGELYKRFGLRGGLEVRIEF
jgi:hypothetical protein